MSYCDLNSKRVHEIIVVAGGASAVATACSMNRTSIYKWIYKGWIPTRRVKKISELSGIPCNTIDPVNFPKN